MFQFTREFIINDNAGKLESSVKFLEKNGTLFVDNMVNIRKQDVNAIYKHPFEAEAKDKVTVKAAAIPTGGEALAAGTVVRLEVILGLEGKVSATFNDYYPDHSRTLFYETIVKSGEATAQKIYGGLKSSFDHETTLSDAKFIVLSVDGSNNLVLEAPDCYTRIKEVRLVSLPQATGADGAVEKIGALLTGYEDWHELVIWKRKDADVDTTKVELTTKGKEGNGNTVQILKNLRLQTAANINPWGLNVDERPVPKGEYDQFMVETVTERRHIGHDCMGSVGTSLTTHVFYVLKAVSAAFEAELEKLGTIVTPVAADKVEDLSKKAKEVKRVHARTSDLPEEDESSSEA